jgi:hypothetical protein
MGDVTAGPGAEAVAAFLKELRGRGHRRTIGGLASAPEEPAEEPFIAAATAVSIVESAVAATVVAGLIGREAITLIVSTAAAAAGREDFRDPHSLVPPFLTQ